MVDSMSSGVIPIIVSTTSLSAIPQIWPTADTRPPANSPCPTTMARGFPGPPPDSSLMIFLEIFANVVSRRGFHAVDKSLIKCLGGVDARVAKQVIHRDDFGHHRDVLTGVEVNRNLGQLYIKNSGCLEVEAGALDHRVLIPLLELDYDLDALLLPHRPDAEDCRNVDEPDTPDFHVVALHLV